MFYYLFYGMKKYAITRDVYNTILDLESREEFDAIDLLFEVSDDIHEINE